MNSGRAVESLGGSSEERLRKEERLLGFSFQTNELARGEPGARAGVATRAGGAARAEGASSRKEPMALEAPSTAMHEHGLEQDALSAECKLRVEAEAKLMNLQHRFSMLKQELKDSG